ncbi:MAG: fibronectin type III domain-containing protein, partial [Ignavibacteria bacterium]|nr:fibronectin type III domain-containing protein [Ignavibacteria bacterium]
KIKAVFTGIQLPDSTKFSQIEYYYFLFNGGEFEMFRDPSQYLTLKSTAVNNDLRVFNRAEVKDVIAHTQDTILKSANQIAHTFTVSGRIQYNDRNDITHPLRYAKVKVYDKNLLFPDELLATTATDASGNYSISITSSESDGPDIYIECLTEGIDNFPSGSSGIADVKDDILSFTYYSETRGYVLENSKTNSTISFTIANAGSDAGNFAVYDSFVEGWIKAKQYLNITIPKAIVYWPSSNTRKVNRFWLEYIEIIQDDRYDRDVILHEYGHFVDSKFGLVNGYGGDHSWGTNMTGEVTNYSDQNSHKYTNEEAKRLAMSEGWATFFSISLQYAQLNDYYYDDSVDQISRDNLEINNYTGSDNEAATCGILWDIFDSGTNETHDNLNESLSEIWRVLEYGEKTNSIEEFATKWQTLNKGNLTALSNIYSHFGINLNITTFNPPRSLTATASDGRISLNWSAPSSETPTGYKVYISTAENGTYTPLSQTIFATNLSIANLTNGSTYWFYVTAVYASGESAASNKVSATPTAGTTTVTTLTVNGSATSGAISASGEADWYKFQTSTAGTYTIQTSGSTDTFMNLYQGDQTTSVTSDDDSGNGNNAMISRTL